MFRGSRHMSSVLVLFLFVRCIVVSACVSGVLSTITLGLLLKGCLLIPWQLFLVHLCGPYAVILRRLCLCVCLIMLTDAVRLTKLGNRATMLNCILESWALADSD